MATIATKSSSPLPRPRGDDELPPLPVGLLWPELAAGWLIVATAFAILWLG